MDLKEVNRFQIVMPEPFDFAITVAKPAGWHWSVPGEVFEDGVLWSGIYTSGRPVGLRMSADGRTVSVTVYAESRLTAGEVDTLKSGVSLGLGEDDDLHGFYEFAKTDAILSRAVNDLYGMRLGRMDDIFGQVILAICLQMAPVARSEKMMADLLKHHGARLHFDGRDVILWPRPSELGRLDPVQLQTSANLGYRAKRLVQAAQFLEKHPITNRALSAMSEDEALRVVMEIPGIGSYSAKMILGRHRPPLDVWSVVVMSELLLSRSPGKPRQDIGKVAAILEERWGRWAWMAFAYILNDLAPLSRDYNLSRIR